MRGRSYNNSVFLNCPFDEDYKPLFRAAVFAVLRCGFLARSAQEIDDSGQSRLAKILIMIGECRYGVHDLSRTELSGDLPRFNMPFELGLFLGSKHFGGAEHQDKNCLIFERTRYSYQKYISDISGQDIHWHSDDPARVISEIRNWLATSSKRKGLPGGTVMTKEYGRFKKWLPGACQAASLRNADLTWTDYWNLVEQWIESGLADRT